MTAAVRPLSLVAHRPLPELGDHQLVARLGRGGMAEIFLARRPGPPGSELVVVKRLHPDDEDDPLISAMFLDEARLALRLTHQNIVRAYALGMLEARPSLVLEFLEGQPLQSLMRRATELNRDLPLAMLVPAFADALEGLHYAHELADETGRPLHVVHRDISPHNLFVTSAGVLKVLDFGIAKTAIQEHRTRTGLLKGKVAYMAPEQAHGSSIDRRADIWSTGVTLWEALTGTRLFKADNEAASLRLTLVGAVERPSSVRPDVPKALDAIVMRALRRDPTQRYATASDMAEELRAFAHERGAALTAPLRPIISELFGRETAEQRLRIAGLLSQGESVPISSSVPALIRSVGQPDAAAGTHVSTVTEFLDQLHERQRSGFRRVGMLLALLAVCVLVLGYALLARPLTRGPARAVALAKVEPAGQVLPPTPAAATTHAGAASVTASAAATATNHGELTAAAHGNHGARHEPAPGDEALVASPRNGAKPAGRAETSVTAVRADVEFGYLTLDTSPWSQVTADGTPLGQTPIVHAKLSAGAHTLVLVNGERGLSTTYQVTIEPGKTSVRRVGLD